MNYLAHLFLAGENPKILLGNYLGDFVKGNVDKLPFDSEIKSGIIMHRRIDILADREVQNLLNQQQLHFEQRRYAGITFDLACDHFLAKNWQEFSQRSLHEFSDFCIAHLQNQQALMPDNAQYVLTRISKYQWLTNYQNMDYMEQVFAAIQRRLKPGHKLEQAFLDLQNNYKNLEFFCKDFITGLPGKL